MGTDERMPSFATTFAEIAMAVDKKAIAFVKTMAIDNGGRTTLAPPLKLRRYAVAKASVVDERYIFGGFVVFG